MSDEAPPDIDRSGATPTAPEAPPATHDAVLDTSLPIAGAAEPPPEDPRQAARAAARSWTSGPAFPPPSLAEFNRLGLDYRRPVPPPPVSGLVIDCHTHLLSAGHARPWFEACDAYGIGHVLTMTPLDEAVRLVRGPFGERVTLIAIPDWAPGAYDEELFWRRVDGFHNLGSRVVKFHLAPASSQRHGLKLGSDLLRRYVHMAIDRGMIVMTHIGDPKSWYAPTGTYGKDPEFYGTRNDHYDAWERLLEETRGWPWWGAHLGGNPEDLGRISRLLDTYPDLMLDTSATKWMVRALSTQRDAAREFTIRHADRLMFGSDQVSAPGRDFDFFASRLWCHRKLWDTAYVGESPIADPDVKDGPPMLRGLALPDEVLQAIYCDNIVRLLDRVGVKGGQATHRAAPAAIGREA